MKFRQSLLIASIVGFAAAIAAPICAAALYKWTDENGRVVYGDQPPPSAKSERLNAGVAPADPTAVRDLANKDADIKKRLQQRADDASKADKEQVDNKRKLDICTQTRGRIKTMREPAPVFRYNEKGEKEYYQAADREKAIADSEKSLREMNCPAAPSS